MDRQYDILNCDLQSHPNVHGNNVLEKKTGMACFCKIIERNDQMKGDLFANAIDTITTVNHPKILKVKEIYADSHSIYLISDSINGKYKNLLDFNVYFEEWELTQLLE